MKKFYEIANDFGRSKEEQDEIMKNAAKRDEKLLDEYENIGIVSDENVNRLFFY
ncbi:hypothetical protein ACIXMR_06940 [Bacteroides fragilis]